jgi:hypothetical protein
MNRVSRFVLWEAVSTKTQARDTSLDVQDRELSGYVESQNGVITARLIVPGHSRSYYNLEQYRLDMRRQKIYALDEFDALCDARAFDVMAVWDGDRLGRSQTVVAYMGERALDIGARIYVHTTRMTMEGSFARMWIGFTGATAAGEIDKLVERGVQGRKARAIRDKRPGVGSLPITHRYQRDERGKVTGIEAIPEMAPFVRALAELLIEGLPYNRKLSAALAARGFINPITGTPYRGATLRGLVFNPLFHGNLRWRDSLTIGQLRYSSRSSFDPSTPPLDNFVIEYGVVPPAIDDAELMERLRAELQRRAQMWRNARSDAHRFTGLVFCFECGNGLVYRKDRKTPTYRCHQPRGAHDQATKRKCKDGGLIFEHEIMEFIDDLARRLNRIDPALRQAEGFNDTAGRRLSALQKTLATLEAQADRAISMQVAAPVELQGRYKAQLDSIAAGIRDTRNQISEAERDVQQTAQQAASLDAMAALDTAALWQLPPGECNRELFAAFGSLRMQVGRHEVTGLIRQLRKKREVHEE